MERIDEIKDMLEQAEYLLFETRNEMDEDNAYRIIVECLREQVEYVRKNIQ